MLVAAGSPVADRFGPTLNTRELVMGAAGVDPAWNNRAVVMHRWGRLVLVGDVGIGNSLDHNLKSPWFVMGLELVMMIVGRH